MTTTNTPKETGGEMSLVRVKQKAQITLPAEARKALKVKEGDYLEAEVVPEGVLLKPVAVIDRSKAWDELMALVAEDKGIDPGLSEEELMDEVAEGIRQARQA